MPVGMSITYKLDGKEIAAKDLAGKSGKAEIEGDPLYNPNRHAMLMKLRWDEDGRPVFSYKD